MKNPNFYTSLEVAKLIDTSRTTVQRWIDAGNLKAFRTIGNHRRVKPEDLVAFLSDQGMPIPTGLTKGSAGKVRILVIDDEARYVKALKAVLERTDKRFEVDVADDSLDGLLAVGARRPDVVLLDAMMPGWDGFEVCRRIKRAPELKGIKVVGMSGSAKNEEAFRKAGVDAFLKKPFDTQIVVAVVAWLGLGSGASPD